MMKMKEIEFYKGLLKDRFEMLPPMQIKASDRAQDLRGVYTASLSSDYRFIGITEFLVNGDVAAFRANLSKCAELELNLLQRFDAGESIAPSFISMVAYKELFDALAAANFSLATHLAQRMGGRVEAEKKNDIPFTRVMGYALKEAVLASGDSARQDLVRLFAGPDEAKDPEEDLDEGLRYEDFRGYGVVLDGIAARNERIVDNGLAMIVEGHIRQSKTGIFQDEDDQFLCVWGIGLANLARHRGLAVHVEHELLPRVLVI